VVVTNPPFGKRSSITVVNEEGDTDRETLGAGHGQVRLGGVVLLNRAARFRMLDYTGERAAG